MEISIGLITAFITAHACYFEAYYALMDSPLPVEDETDELFESRPIIVALDKERTTAKVLPSQDVQRRLKRIERKRKEQEKNALTAHEIEINF